MNLMRAALTERSVARCQPIETAKTRPRDDEGLSGVLEVTRSESQGRSEAGDGIARLVDSPEEA